MVVLVALIKFGQIHSYKFYVENVIHSYYIKRATGDAGRYIIQPHQHRVELVYAKYAHKAG